ncbi:MAG: undecaprenyl/decaprenyl-phosphate alpha-N-acetylglucosaminyl 1-phosphate transferase [Spirochaetaceae bacterium]|nr:MAG: undecaprenyl/decaprenyl-phosphate alpha-N-acetylglucosaminyl 1-phosphate transferase [Spirochaetaceae bacterium]
MEPLLVVAVAATGLVLNLILTPSIIRISHHFRWYDRPNHRKIHKVMIPRLGGVGIFTSFFLSIIIVPIVFNAFFNIQSYNSLDIRFLSIFLGFFIIYLLGLMDDFVSLKAIFKLLIQIVAASVVTAGGYVVNKITLPYIGTFPLGVLAYPLTIIWIVGITNALNLVDGMDGLGGGIAAFASFSMGIISLIQNEVAPAIMAFALFGAIIGFLKFNFPPAKIFMGDSGSLFLGFALAVLPLMGISRAGSFSALLIPITVLMVPIIDTLAAIIRRIKKRTSIAAPDKEHIHHKLLDLGFSEKKILAVIYSICLYLSVISISITSEIMPDKAINVFIVLIVWIGLILGYGILHLIQSKKRELKAKNDQIEKSKTG